MWGYRCSPGGGWGSSQLLGPTGGDLVGFVAGAWVVGWLCEHGCDKRVHTATLAMLAGNITIYLFGLLWLVRFVGTHRVLTLGVLPFIPGDLLKIGLAALALPFGWKVAGQPRRW